jgi:diaminohydroxyphosphoribosylaminopyrimidine deaminase/5-amino-6-(5-phosphoribosylamino)uracil reductase
MDDSYFMKMCLALAAKGRGFTSPNPLVGAVVVKNNKVVGKGYHRMVGGPHAEVNAIDDAGPNAKGGTLYVNLEPCNHTGRTPPCTEAIIQAGIKRTVIGMDDPNPGVKGGGADRLERCGLIVSKGICQKEAKKLNEAFIKYVRSGRPFVTVKCAATLDGRIASRTGDSKWITGSESRRFVHELRHAADAIMVGVETVKKDDPSLTARLPQSKSRDPVRIILDTHLSIKDTAKILHLESDSDTLIFTADDAAADGFADKKATLENKGARVIGAPAENGFILLDPLMVQLGAQGITSLIIEGGARVIASALRDGIVDKIIFFYAPKILGGDDGIPMCRGPGPDRISECLPVKDIRIRRFGDDIMLEGYIEKDESRCLPES